MFMKPEVEINTTISRRAFFKESARVGGLSLLVGSLIGGGVVSLFTDDAQPRPREDGIEQVSQAHLIAQELLLNRPIPRLNGVLTQEKADGTLIWSEPVAVPASDQAFAPLDPASYKFFTIHHTNGVPVVRPIKVASDMKMVANSDGRPLIQDVFVTPFMPADLTAEQDPADAHNYAVSGFVEPSGQAQSRNQRGGVAFIGAEPFLRPKS